MATEDNLDPATTLQQMLATKVDPPQFQSTSLEFAPTSLDPAEEKKLKLQALGDAFTALSEIARGRTPGPVGTALQQRQAQLKQAEAGNRAIRNESAFLESSFTNSLKREDYSNKLALKNSLIGQQLAFDRARGVEKDVSARKVTASLAAGEAFSRDGDLSDDRIMEIAEENGVPPAQMDQVVAEARFTISQDNRARQERAENLANSSELYSNTVERARQTAVLIGRTLGLNNDSSLESEVEREHQANLLMVKYGLQDNLGIKTLFMESMESGYQQSVSGKGLTIPNIEAFRKVQEQLKNANTVKAMAIRGGMNAQLTNMATTSGALSPFAALLVSDPKNGMALLDEDIESLKNTIELFKSSMPALQDPSPQNPNPNQGDLDDTITRMTMQWMELVDDPSKDPRFIAQINHVIAIDKARKERAAAAAEARALASHRREVQFDK